MKLIKLYGTVGQKELSIYKKRSLRSNVPLQKIGLPTY